MAIGTAWVDGAWVDAGWVVGAWQQPGGATSPIVDAGGPYSGQVSTPIQLTATVTPGSDPNPTYLWSIQSGGTGTFSGGTTLTPTFTPDATGSYVLLLTVSTIDTADVTDTADLTSSAVSAVLSLPTASALGATASTGTVTTDSNTGTVYWVDTLVATQPTPTQIKAGQDDLGAPTPNNNATVSASGLQSNLITSGLTASTTYFRHYVHDNGLDSNVVTTASYTTGATGSGSLNVASRQSGIIF